LGVNAIAFGGHARIIKLQTDDLAAPTLFIGSPRRRDARALYAGAAVLEEFLVADEREKNDPGDMRRIVIFAYQPSCPFGCAYQTVIEPAFSVIL
jgi:hypothetical protein